MYGHRVSNLSIDLGAAALMSFRRVGTEALVAVECAECAESAPVFPCDRVMATVLPHLDRESAILPDVAWANGMVERGPAGTRNEAGARRTAADGNGARAKSVGAVREIPQTEVAHRLARRAAAFGPSFWAGIDALFPLHPDIVYFGGGIPAPELMPIARMRHGAELAWGDGPAGLVYGEVDGYAPLRELIAARMTAQGTPVLPGQVVTTHGSQQGIDLTAKLLLDPGDAVVVEAPTFLDAIRTYQSYEAVFIEVPVDAQGMRTDLLAEALATTTLRPKMIYTVPTFQNPTGTTLSLARRHELLCLAREHHLTVVEDDPYGELRYDGEPLPTLRSLDAAVVHLGTFSKTLAPGLRVGWAVVPEALNEPFQMAKEAADSHTARMMTRTVFHTATNFLDDHVALVRTEYRHRREELLLALAAEMPDGVGWSRPDGGFFVWVTLPPTLTATALLPAAAANGVIYLPGTGFYASGDPAGDQALRLNFSSLSPERIREGVRRLGEVMRAAVAAR